MKTAKDKDINLVKLKEICLIIKIRLLVYLKQKGI